AVPVAVRAAPEPARQAGLRGPQPGHEVRQERPATQGRRPTLARAPCRGDHAYRIRLVPGPDVGTRAGRATAQARTAGSPRAAARGVAGREALTVPAARSGPTASGRLAPPRRAVLTGLTFSTSGATFTAIYLFQFLALLLPRDGGTAA